MYLELILVFILYSEVYSVCQKSVTTASGSYAPAGTICSGDLIFVEDFNELRLDLWNHEETLGGRSSNNQFQWYTNNRNNSFVDNGILHIRPTLVADEYGEAFLYNGTIDLGTTCTTPLYDGCLRKGTKEIILNPIKSARINTNNTFTFKYGKVEVRAKAPLGDWLWPAVWMNPHLQVYSSWPRSGEIDLMESRGNKNLYLHQTNIGVEQNGCTLHWGPNAIYDRYKYTHFPKNNKDGWNTKFHTYQLEWRPENITFFIDNNFIGVVSPPTGGFWELGKLNSTGFTNLWENGTNLAPFDQEFYFICNIAVGGTSFFSDMASNTEYAKPWFNTDGRASMTKFWKAEDDWLPTWDIASDSSHLQIDYIKVRAL
ncbi:unnamed protein product [Phyllotreta striolata]|uniref:GH16 domain-containing protein n=1 Tax=Phyllotreta striolata TaxID=444603 RepID=A0A9N9TIV8_PHYSR|nr:unnamed protein product [Phyllotreta striolata]